MAGYSGTPLAKKLGIKPNYRVAFADDLHIGLLLQQQAQGRPDVDVVIGNQDSHVVTILNLSSWGASVLP